MKQYLETGKIVNTHALAGAVKVMHWSDGPAFLKNLRRVYIDGKAYEVTSASIQKGFVLMKLAGVDSVEAAMRLRERIVYVDRDDVELPEGRYFVQDMLGMTVHDLRGGRDIGTLKDVLNLPAGDVYAVQNGTAEYLIPATPVFVKEIDADARVITVETIKGMTGDE